MKTYITIHTRPMFIAVKFQHKIPRRPAHIKHDIQVCNLFRHQRLEVTKKYSRYMVGTRNVCRLYVCEAISLIRSRSGISSTSFQMCLGTKNGMAQKLSQEQSKSEFYLPADLLFSLYSGVLLLSCRANCCGTTVLPL